MKIKKEFRKRNRAGRESEARSRNTETRLSENGAWMAPRGPQ